MTDPQGRAEILTGGPGEPVNRWEPTDLRAGEPDQGGSQAEEPAARPGAWRALARGVFSPESLAVTGLVLAILPWFSVTVLSRLSAALALPETEPNEGFVELSQLARTIAGVSTAIALLGAVAGLVALRRAEPGSRVVIGLGGAAVLIGALAAAAHVMVVVAGPAPGYYGF